MHPAHNAAVKSVHGTVVASTLMALVIVIALTTTAVPALSAEKKTPLTVTVSVGRLTAPFLAYGLEKKLYALGGVSSVKLHTMRGTVEVGYKDKDTYNKEALEETVKAAGFIAKRIRAKRVRVNR